MGEDLKPVLVVGGMAIWLLTFLVDKANKWASDETRKQTLQSFAGYLSATAGICTAVAALINHATEGALTRDIADSSLTAIYSGAGIFGFSQAINSFKKWWIAWRNKDVVTPADVVKEITLEKPPAA